MNDEDLLGYFEIHSRTERALFHRGMVVRLFELADEDLSGVGAPEWHTMRSEYSDPLVKRARARMDVDAARFALIAGFMYEDPDHGIRMSLKELATRAYLHHEGHHEDAGDNRDRLRNRVLESENACLRADLTDALEALRWCSGAKDFQDGEHASSGYNKIVHPVIVRLRDRLSGDGK